jgi:hypothetical protein
MDSVSFRDFFSSESLENTPLWEEPLPRNDRDPFESKEMRSTSNTEFVGLEYIKISFKDKKKLDDYKYYEQSLGKKRRTNNNVEKVHKKKGRKTTKNSTKVHDKLSPDNIVSKVKTKIMESCRSLTNIILCHETGQEVEEKIKKIKYNKVKGLKTEEELKFWDQDLKTLFSNDISCKFKKTPKNSNQKFIDDILHNNPSDTILFVLSLTFGEWFNIFTYKKDLNDYENDYPNVNFKLIKDNFIGANILYNEIKENKNNTEEYSDQFLYYLHNYRAYYENRKRRKTSKSKIGIGIDNVYLDSENNSV